MRELFIYYRAHPDRAAELQAEVARVHAALRLRFPGLQARLLRRPETDERGLHTWMETYALPGLSGSSGLGAAHEAAIAEATAALAPMLSGNRHTERFDACAS